MVTTPVFIVACPRSGTTKLASLLNRHSLVAAATETHFFNHVAKLSCFDAKGKLKLSPDNLARFFAEPRVLDFLAVAQLSEAELRAAMFSSGKPELERKQVFDIMMQLVLAARQKQIFCEKTPQHLQNLNEILALYPQAKFIHLIRDGRDVVNSLIKMPWRPPGLINNARFWLRYIKLGEAAERHIPASNLATYKYEDLLLEPETTLKSICEFIGISYEPNILGSSSSEPVFANWEAEWKHKASQELDPSRIGAWREEFSDDSAAIVNCFLAPTLKRLGYTVSGEHRHRLTIKHCIIIVTEFLLLGLTRLLRMISLQNNILFVPKLFAILLSLSILSPVLAKPLQQAIVRGPYLQMTKSDSTIIRYRTKQPLITQIKYSEMANSSELKTYTDDVLKTEHEVLLTGLKPGTRYIYSLHAYKKSKAKELGRGSYFFKTAPLVGSETRVWVLGDSGTSETVQMSKYANDQLKVRDAMFKYLTQSGVIARSEATKRHCEAGTAEATPLQPPSNNTGIASPSGLTMTADPDMMLMLGDNTYWYGKDEEYTKGLFKPYAMQLSAMPVFPVLGNHDSGYQQDLRGYSARSYPHARGAYYDAFTLPEQAELGGIASNTEAYYSFDYGAAHYIMLDSYDSHEQNLDTEFPSAQASNSSLRAQRSNPSSSDDDSVSVEPKLNPNNRMVTWLKADLEAFAKAHPDPKTRPWLIAVFHHPVHTMQEEDPARKNFWKRWLQLNIQPLLEEYSTDIVFAGHVHRYERTKALAKGSNYIVLGSSGSSFGKPRKELGEFLVSSDAEGSGLMDINATQLNFKFIDKNSQVIDSFTLNK